MVYLYLSEECQAEDHRSCAGKRDMPKNPGPDYCGGGICTCQCHAGGRSW